MRRRGPVMIPGMPGMGEILARINRRTKIPSASGACAPVEAPRGRAELGRLVTPGVLERASRARAAVGAGRGGGAGEAAGALAPGRGSPADRRRCVKVRA